LLNVQVAAAEDDEIGPKSCYLLEVGIEEPTHPRFVLQLRRVHAELAHADNAIGQAKLTKNFRGVGRDSEDAVGERPRNSGISG
jgi:hypothetical protein